MKYSLRKTIINIYRKISFFTVSVLGFHSDSYIEILREIHNKGGETKDSWGRYQPWELRFVYKWERETLENEIVNAFNRRVPAAYKYLCFLKYYDGRDMLVRALRSESISLSDSFDIAILLYYVTKEQKYIEVVKQVIATASGTDLANELIGRLALVMPDSIVYGYLKQLYLTVPSLSFAAMRGILYYLGYNSYDGLAILRNTNKRTLLLNDSLEKRQSIIQRLEDHSLASELEITPIHNSPFRLPTGPL